MTEKLQSWFNSRGISQLTLDRFGVTEGIEWMPQHGTEVNTMQFNYLLGDEIMNTKYRDGKKNFKLVQGAPKIFYNINSLIDDSNDYIVVVEGEIDALSYGEAGISSVISVPNGATKQGVNADYLDDYIDYFDTKENVILAFDDDEPGQALQQEFIRRLGPESCSLADFDGCKDANEYLVKHGISKLADTVANATQVPLDHVITYNDIKEEVEDFVKNGFKPGYQIGLESFDRIFSTYTGQFITVTGIPTHGKSDFVDRMAVGYNKNYGWKVGYASPENLPTQVHVHKLIRKYWGAMPEPEDIGSEKWNKITEHIENNYYFINKDRFYLDEVLAKGAELVKRKGIKVLVLDPFNKITMQGVEKARINEYTMEYLQKIDEFCKKYDVLAIIVAHPTKMYKDNNGKQEEPSMYSIKGGGEWFDASYHGLLVHRDFQAKTVKVKVMKVKFQNLGENGAEAVFTWSQGAGDYIPVAEEHNTLPF